MKYSTKKIIAIEFLLLIAAILLALLVFGSTYLININTQQKINELNPWINSKASISDSLNYNYNLKRQKQLQFHDQLLNFIYQYNNQVEKRNIWESIEFDEHNPTVYKFDGNTTIFDTTLNYFNKNNELKFSLNAGFSEFKKHFKFNSLADFKSFILKYQINEVDQENLRKSKLIDKEKSELLLRKEQISSTIFSFQEQKKWSFRTLIFLVVIFFPFRYLYYAVRWSFKVLTQKNAI